VRHHLASAAAIVAALTIFTPLAAQTAQPRQAEPDNFAKAQAFVAAVYPELAKPREFYVWFKTLVAPLTPVASNHSSTFTIHVVTAKDMEAAHHHHTPFDPFLVADVRFNRAGEIREFEAHGCRYAHADRTEALHAELLKHAEMTDEALLQAFRTAEMRFLPGQRDRLLTHVRPVIAEMERRYGKLEIDSVEEPRRDPESLVNGVPGPVLYWTIRASTVTRTAAPRRDVVMLFEPYDGRLVILRVD
jgi:hypothetical protein